LIKQSTILIFDEATSSLEVATAEHFCATINQLKGKVTMLFITHALPKNLQVDEIVQTGCLESFAGSRAQHTRSGGNARMRVLLTQKQGLKLRQLTQLTRLLQRYWNMRLDSSGQSIGRTARSSRALELV
jgi:ABC-type transport system involved in cytochrome bd biosynthesis fused ATPase/permease subunit